MHQHCLTFPGRLPACRRLLGYMVYGRRLPRIYAPGVLHKHDSRDVFSDFVLLFYILLLFNPGQLTTIPCEYAELDGTSGNSAVLVAFF